MDFEECECNEDHCGEPCDNRDGNTHAAEEFLEVGPDGIADAATDDAHDQLTQSDGADDTVLNLDVLRYFYWLDWHLPIIPCPPLPFHYPLWWRRRGQGAGGAGGSLCVLLGKIL